MTWRQPKFLGGTLFAEQKAEPLGWRVSWTKTDVQAFVDILDKTVEPIPVELRMWESHRRLPTLVASLVIADSPVYQLRTRNQSMTGTSLEAMNSLDEGVWRCRYLSKRTKIRISLAGPPGLSLFLCDLVSDRRAKTEAEFLSYYVASPNPWLPMA